MKKSNVVLLSMLGCIVVTIAMIPVMYNLAYQAKKSSLAGTRYTRRAFDARKIVVLKNLKDVVIIPADTLAVEIDKTQGNPYHIIENGDSLLIMNDDLSPSGSLMIFLPTGHRIIAFDSRILIKGALQILDPPSVEITLNNSHLYSTFIARDPKVTQVLGRVTINDNGNSIVEFTGRLDIAHLTLRNVRGFNCTPDVGIHQTDFSFDGKLEVRASTCMEGLFVDSR
jgi:hypothetical protein